MLSNHHVSAVCLCPGPPRRLVQSFRALWSEEVKLEGTTRVTWLIEPVGDSCRQTRRAGLLVFGRETYDLMVSYWPTPVALEQNREIAEGMNPLPKLVFSRTLGKSDWNNATVVKGDPVAELRKRKEAGLNITILGSGNLVAQLAPSGVIAEYQMILCPVVLGQGRTMFEGVPKQLRMAPTKVRQFRNGKVLLHYERAS